MTQWVLPKPKVMLHAFKDRIGIGVYFTDLRKKSCSAWTNCMPLCRYVKEDLIIPHNVSFYELIKALFYIASEWHGK